MTPDIREIYCSMMLHRKVKMCPEDYLFLVAFDIESIEVGLPGIICHCHRDKDGKCIKETQRDG